MHGGTKRMLEEMEKLPGDLCPACTAEELVFHEEIRAGGIHFKCRGCGTSGVVKRDNPVAKEVRDKLNLHDGQPCGVEVDSCPKCPDIEA